MNRIIAVSEIFLTVQGEGALIGKPTVFVRAGGCDYQYCSWCDSLYAVLPEYKSTWKQMTAQEIFAEVQKLSPEPILITLSGGNPAIQPLEPLLDIGKDHKYTFCIETQGSIARSWFKRLDYLTLSPKPPSSGMITRWDRLTRCVEIANDEDYCQVIMKIVIFNDQDYAYAHEVAERYPFTPLYLQAGNEHVGEEFSLNAVLNKLTWLVEKVTQERWNNVTILPQMHTLIWANTRGK